MTKYLVKLYKETTTYYDYIVEANSKKEADAVARNKLANGWDCASKYKEDGMTLTESIREIKDEQTN